MSSKLVITISREHGSGGSQIAQEVARKLRFTYVDSHLIRLATKQMDIDQADLAEFDERVLPQLDEISDLITSHKQLKEKDLALSEVLAPNRDRFSRPPVRPAATSLDPTMERRAASYAGYHKLVSRVLGDVANKGGAVIVGRGSQFILKERPHTAHLHLYAPLADRIQRLVQLDHLTEQEARQQIQQNDEQRTNYTQRYYQADWRDPAHYHMLLNTSQVSLEAAVSTIVQLAHFIESQASAPTLHSTYEQLNRDSYSLKEAADLLWISPDLLRQAVYRGELKATLIDHRINRISRNALVEWLRGTRTN